MKNYVKPSITDTTENQLEIINASSCGCPKNRTVLNRSSCLGINDFYHTQNQCPYFIPGNDPMDLRYGKCVFGVAAPTW